jgi:hypothetical protein
MHKRGRKMRNMKEIFDKDMMLASIVEKYSEWLEMSDEPEYMLIDILANLLFKEKELTKYLNKIAYLPNNTGNIGETINATRNR